MNQVVDLYRKYLAQTGQTDSSTDYQITQALGQWAQQSNPNLFQQFPDFAEEFGQIREANAPSLSGEFGTALKSGTQGLASTALGGLGLLTDSDYLKEKAASFEQDAAANAPTIPTLEDIAPGREGVGSLLSKDAVRYGVSKMGSVVPSIAEGIGAAAIGSALGTAAAPGPGTIAGAAEGLVARGLIKSAIRSLVKKGVAEELMAKGIITEASEAALEQAIRSGAKGAIDKVGLEAMSIGAKRGLAATNLANSFLLNVGDVASEGADTPTTLALGLVSAIPDSVLPGYVVKRMFPGVQASKALPLAKQFVGDRAAKVLEAAGLTAAEAGTEYFQEAVNVVARNLKDGKDALDFTDEDLRRFREAGIAGAFGGAVATPSLLASPPEQTTADVPTLPGPELPPLQLPAEPVANPYASLFDVPPTEGVTTPFDAVRAAGQEANALAADDEAGRLLAEQQEAITRGLATQEQQEEEARVGLMDQQSMINQLISRPEAPDVPAADLGRAMMGETPEVAAEREARRQAYGLAGVPVPDASDPDQLFKREAEAAGRAMVGNIAPELSEPIPAAPGATPAPPQSLAASVSEMDPERFRQWAVSAEGGFTTQAYNEGIAAIGNAAKLEELKALQVKAQKDYSRVSDATKSATKEEQLAAFDTLSSLGSKLQFFNEAIAAAENSGSARGAPAVTAAHEKATLAKLPADIVAQVAAASAGAQPSPIAPPPGGDAATEAALAVPTTAQQGSGTPTVVPSARKGKRIGVGVGAGGMPDILNAIEEMGGVRSARSQKNPGGEYDRQDMTFNGTARLLLRNQGGLAPDELASRLHDEGLLPDGLPETLFAAVQKAVTARQQQRKQAGAAEYLNRFEAAFLGDQRSKKWLMAGNPITVDDLAVGNTFEVNGEKFTVKEIDEDGNVTIQDGITKTYPAGTPVFPDKGKVKAKRTKIEFVPDSELNAPAPAEIVQQVAPAAAPDATVPKAAPIPAAKPFKFGPVVESAPTMDFRSSPESANLTPEQWSQLARENMKLGPRASQDSSKSDSRIGMVLQAPDGRVIVTGLTLPVRTLSAAGQNILKEPTLQKMGIDRFENRKQFRDISVSGNRPALLTDVVAGGFQPLAVIHFSGDPGIIHEVFPSQTEFDAAWGASPKTQGKNVQPPALRAAIPRAAQTEAELSRQIERRGDDLLRASAEDRPAIIDDIRALYAKLDAVTRQNQDITGDTHPPEYRRGSAPSEAIQATKHAEFQKVVANLQQLGMKVDVFSREFLAQSTSEEIERRLAALNQQAQQTADPVVKAELARRQGVLQERLQAVQQAAGVTYTPWHVAIAADDIGKASANNLVTLLHEAAEALTMRLPVEQRGAVRTAINKSMASIRERAATAAAQTGVPLARETSPTDLLAETLAQELTAAGIPDAPSLAAAIWRWVKDAYYRVAMAIQAGFGAEPNPEVALDWYENQLRREVYGDFNYEFANLLNRFIPSPIQERITRYDGRNGTPGGIPDFLDPVAGVVRQPQVETLDRDSLNWNLEFQQPGQPGAELDIPDPEARARIKGGVLNALADFYEKTRLDVAPDMDWTNFFGQIKRTGEEDPKLLIADLNQRIPESGNAKIGGERMTDPMNRAANVELWGRFRKLGLSLRRQLARGERTIADASRQFTEYAQEVNRLEGDLRNAALHSDQLKEKAKGLVRGLASSIAQGRSTSHLQGALAESIRETENLLEGDPIPQAYREVLKRVYDGEQPVFDYVRAIAELDLPLTEMTNSEVIKAIREGSEFSPPLANLTSNRPLMVVLATLARKNADQVDQIQLGWLRDTSRFREITQKLNEIKTATGEQLAELNRQFTARGKASGLLARLQSSYLAKRRRQQAASDRIAAAEARNELIEKVLPAVDEATADAAQAAGGAQYEWAPEEGAVWTAMRQDSEGNWRRHERVLRFRPDGSAEDGDQLRQDIAGNIEWLAARRSEEGKPRYNQIAAQTYALKLLDARGQQQRTWNSGILNAVDRFVRTPIASARSLGGPAMQRVIQMLNRYQFILRNYGKSLEAPAAEWQHEFVRMRDASGLKDNGEFIEQVYKPAMYFFSVNPGLEEGPAIRQASTLVRKGLQNPREDFNERFAAFIRKTIQNEKTLLGIAEQYGVFVADKQLGSELRRALPRGILTGLRSLNGGVVDVLMKDMQTAGWQLRYDENVKDGVVTKTNPRAVTFAPLDPRNAADPQQAEAVWATLGNAEALRPLFSKLFTGPIIGQWLEPFIRKPGQEPFSFEGEPIPQELVRSAWEQSGGDVLGWIDRLGQSLEVQPDAEGHSGEAVFRLSMLRNLDQLFGHEAKIAYEASVTPGLLDPHGAKPHALMDARVSDLLPPEHVNFATYEPENMHRLLTRIAYHGAFGRNAKNIQAAFRENMNYLQGLASEFKTVASLHATNAGRAAEAAARGWNYDELKTASKRYDEMKTFQSELESVLGVTANAGPLGDFSKAMSMMNFVVGQIVDNPKTAFYNLLSPAMRPFAQRSLGPATISNTVKTYADMFGRTAFGSLLQSFGLHLFKAGKYADTIGNSEGRAFSNLPVSVILSDIGHAGDNQGGLDKWLVKPLKIARNLQRKGAQVGLGEATEFPRLSVIPGLGVINSISNIEVQAGGSSLAREFEQLIRDGVTYMSAHPEAASNPSFQFKPSDLYKFKLDQPLFDWWKQKTVEYNLGNIEDIVRDAARRQASEPSDRLLTDDQALTLSMINQNEFSGNSSINTTPGWLMTNQMLRMAMPLLRWPLWMMSAVHEAAKPRAGESGVKPMMRALGTLALWNLPMGIAFSLLMDEYDKRLLGKKSNLPEVSGYSALPLVGIPLTLLTSDKPMSDIEAMLVRSARAGNIYGLGQDVASQTLVGLDPTTGQRSVSLDQRVLIMSQLTNLQQAFRNYANQGYATWGSVARPVLMASGGNGILHSVDITNKLLGLDNAQSRMTERAAAANWIRTAAQELDIEVRKGAFGGVPTPMSGRTREMYLAALANDRADFLEQYRLALNEAREVVADDPTIPGPEREKEARKRVLSSWQSRNPFSVLSSRPTPQQVQRMLAIMDPKGQESVRTAMQRYETYSALIEPSPVEKFLERQMTSIRSQSDPEALRRRMMGSMQFSLR